MNRKKSGAKMELVKQFEEGRLQAQKVENLEEAFFSFVDVKEKSEATYRKGLKNFFAFINERGITSPTRPDILAYKDHLKAEGLKATSIKTYLSSVKAFFSWASSELGTLNPTKGVKAPTLSRDFKKMNLSAEQAKALLENASQKKTLEGLRNYAILRLLITTGLRTIEVSRALVEDLRPHGEYMALYVLGKGKDEKGDFVKVGGKTLEALQAYLKARGPVKGSEPLFASSGISSTGKGSGEPLRTESLSRIVKNALKASGFNSPYLTAHSLRHTCATLNLLNGGSLEETRQLLRHSSINTTLIYSHHLDREKNESEARIESALN